MDLVTGYLTKMFDQSNIQRFETDIDLETGDYIVYLSDYNRRWITVSKETANLFGEDLEILKHNVSDSELTWSYKFSKNFGRVYYSAPAYMGYAHFKLIGCVINSTVYGDTTFTY